MRLLDIVVPTYNRPAKLFEMLRTGLALGIEGAHFVVIDDGSTVAEAIDGHGVMDTAQVCAHFGDERVIYLRNPGNNGLAYSWGAYYAEHAQAKYTVSVVDKDRFIAKAPLVSALRKLEADERLVMVCIPLLQEDRTEANRLIGFTYPRLTGAEFISRYVHDANLMHAGGYAIKRVSAIRAAGLPRNMGLKQQGLDDMFGIDIDLVLMLAAQGDVDFEAEPYIRRSTLGGGTEKYPLTFAYTYYQYAKRLVDELRQQGVMSEADARHYLGWWHRMILRGMVVAYRPVRGSELERGAGRIRNHLNMLPHRYVQREMRRYGVVPSRGMRLHLLMAWAMLPFVPFKRLGLRCPSIRLAFRQRLT